MMTKTEEMWKKFNAAKNKKKQTAQRIIDHMKDEHYKRTGVMLADSDFEVW